MSEHQIHEFVALDRALTDEEMAALRRVSTRADISCTRFWNEYHWGDLKADPVKLLAKYFDAYLYFASFGTRCVLLRMPADRADKKALAPYFPAGGPAQLHSVGKYLILSFSSDTEPDGDERPGSLATLASLRLELLQGDFRPAYLAWLLAVQDGAVLDNRLEPPVPPGLGKLSAAQQAMVEYLRLTPKLVRAAAQNSAPLRAETPAFRQWIKSLSARDKDAWLARAASTPSLPLGGELLRTFRAKQYVEPHLRRTVAELEQLADKLPGTRRRR